MARKKNLAFTGVGITDLDSSVPTFLRGIEDTAGDVALLKDKLTGENSELDVITHDGSGTGCPLGVPLVNQYIGRSLILTNPTTKDANGGIGQMIMAPYSVFLSTGEDTIEVELYFERAVNIAAGNPHVKVFSTAMVEQADVPMDVEDLELGARVLTARITGLGSGRHLVFPLIDTEAIGESESGSGNVDVGVLTSASIHHGRRGTSTIPVRSETNIVGVTTPSATQGLAHRDFDETMFGELQPIDSITLQGINHNLNGIDENMRAWPAGGNATYVHEDHDSGGAADDVNPARSRFHAHTRSLYADEPEVNFPVFSVSFGPHLLAGKFAVELAEPPTFGALDWHPPWPIATADQIVATFRCLIPDFQTAASNLELNLFIGSDGDADVGDWTVTVETPAGTSAGVNPVACDGTNDWWLATVVAIPFSPDVEQTISIRMERTGAKTGIGELCLLTADLCFEW